MNLYIVTIDGTLFACMLRDQSKPTAVSDCIAVAFYLKDQAMQMSDMKCVPFP